MTFLKKFLGFRVYNLRRRNTDMAGVADTADTKFGMTHCTIVGLDFWGKGCQGIPELRHDLQNQYVVGRVL